jgi:Holliday junction DNA helicase RuvA
MIASLRGRIEHRGPDHVIVDVSGVGYQVHVPLSTAARLPGDGAEVCLHIHTHLREDSLSLFGFLTRAEKDVFLLLLSVTGIGPKLALAMLSSLNTDEIVCAIRSDDDSRLCAIPGIGKKTAGRIMLELKDKVRHLSASISAAGGPSAAAAPALIDDATSALVNLGYKKALAEETLKRLMNGRSGIRVEELIREALNALMQR